MNRAYRKCMNHRQVSPAEHSSYPNSASYFVRVFIFAVSLTFLASEMPASALANESRNLPKRVGVSVQTDNPIAVSGDDTSDAYHGTGGLLLPASYSGTSSSRRTIADCMDCFWRYTIYCSQGATGLCAHAVSTCPVGKIRYRVWFGNSLNELEVVGSLCWGLGEPLTRRDVETKISQSALRYVPALNPGVAPKASTFTSVPIIVWAGQHSLFIPKPMVLSGRRVEIKARAMWQWIWGDGSAQWTTNPGIRYPGRTLMHQFAKAGRYQIEVKTLWQATYSVAGIGVFAVSSDLIQQSKKFPIEVRTGRAVLVAN